MSHRPRLRARSGFCFWAHGGAISAGLATLPAWVASIFAPSEYAWLVYAIVGGTTFMVFWWALGRVFARFGLVVK